MTDDKRRLLYQYWMGTFEGQYLPLDFVDEDNTPWLVMDKSPEWTIDQDALPPGIERAYYLTLEEERAFSDLRLTSDKPQYGIPDIFEIASQIFVSQKALDLFKAHAPDLVLSHPVFIFDKDGRPYTDDPYYYLMIRIKFKFDRRDKYPKFDSNINPSRNGWISALAWSPQTYAYVSRFPFWRSNSGGEILDAAGVSLGAQGSQSHRS